MHFNSFLLSFASFFFARALAIVLTQQDLTVSQPAVLSLFKVPGQSPAYHCDNPRNDIFQIRRLDFLPTNVRM